MANKIPAFLLKPSPVSAPGEQGRTLFPQRGSFIDKGLKGLSQVIKTGYIQWELASKEGLFQKLDARIKTLAGIFFIIIVSLKQEIMPEAAIAVFILLLCITARINLFEFYRRVLFFGFIFGFLIAAPSALNLIRKGEIIIPLIQFSRSYDFWIYHIPAEIGITREGSYGVGLLTLRVMNSIAISLFVLYTTYFQDIIKALKTLRVPDVFLMIITLSYKYIFIFAKTVEDMHLAKKSRLLGELDDAKGRQWVTGRIAFIFRKTQLKCDEIFKAMLGRGFTNDVRLPGFKKMGILDWAAGISFFSVGILFLWI